MPKCINCGKEFKIKFRSNEKYCSTECGQQFYKNKNKEQRFCLVCGKELPPRRRSYCSDECRYKGKIAYQIYRNNELYKKPKAEAEEKPKRKRGRPKKMPSLSDINALAREEGLTYGQYCAKYGLY